MRQLREAVKHSGTRVKQLFQQIDDDGSGIITKKEFAVAVRMLGFEATREQSDELFGMLDSDS